MRGHEPPRFAHLHSRPRTPGAQSPPAPGGGAPTLARGLSCESRCERAALDSHHSAQLSGFCFWGASPLPQGAANRRIRGQGSNAGAQGVVDPARFERGRALGPLAKGWSIVTSMRRRVCVRARMHGCGRARVGSGGLSCVAAHHHTLGPMRLCGAHSHLPCMIGPRAVVGNHIAVEVLGACVCGCCWARRACRRAVVAPTGRIGPAGGLSPSFRRPGVTLAQLPRAAMRGGQEARPFDRVRRSKQAQRSRSLQEGFSPGAPTSL